MVRSFCAGQIFRVALNGGRVYVVAAKNDDLSQSGSKTTADSADDAMDDAADVCVLFLLISQWAGFVLGNFKPHGGCHTVFYYRFGRIIASESCSGGGTSALRSRRD